MKKFFKIVVVVFVLIFIFIMGTFLIVKNTKVSEIKITDVDLNKIEDGTYSGEYSTKLVKAKVEVNVKDNKIISIIIKQHDNGLGKKAEKITNAIIDKQSLQVDDVSGATMSSNVIKKAVEIALTEK